MLHNNYIFEYFFYVRFVKKTRTTLLTKGDFYPIIDSPDMNTLNYAFVLVYKQEIRQSAHLALKIAKVGLV